MVIVHLETDCDLEDRQAVDLIAPTLKQACCLEQLPSVELCVVIVDDTVIKELNSRFRGKDQVTDVLAFSLWDSKADWEVEPSGRVLLGDIVISLPRACMQAENYGHSLARELAFLAVHGFYHLLGYQHETKEQAEEMFAKQERVLQLMGLKR